VFKPDISNIANINIEMFNKNPLPPMSTLQRANLFSLLVFVFLVLLPNFLPESFILTEILGNLGPLGVAILLTGIMCVVKTGGRPILDFKAVASKSINWEIYIMVAVAMAISAAFTNPATGVVDMMIVVFDPILGGHSPITFFILMLLITIFATSFAPNVVIGIALMPVIIAIGSATEANLLAVTATSILLLHYAVILPSASGFAAMLWSNKEWLTTKEVVKYGAAIVIFSTVIAIAVIMPISLVLFN